MVEMRMRIQKSKIYKSMNLGVDKLVHSFIGRKQLVHFSFCILFEYSFYRLRQMFTVHLCSYRC